jgi:hypothetical protein
MTKQNWGSVIAVRCRRDALNLLPLWSNSGALSGRHDPPLSKEMRVAASA